jgi:TonB family protein
MKPIFITITLIITFSAVKAQTKAFPPDVDIKEPVYSTVQESPQQEIAPEYPGGISKFYRYIQDSLKYPEKARRKNIQGKVFISFVVDKDGSLTNVKVIKGVSSEINAEAIRLIKESPKWKPGMQNGNAVRVQYAAPIPFELTKKDDN